MSDSGRKLGMGVVALCESTPPVPANAHGRVACEIRSQWSGSGVEKSHGDQLTGASQRGG